MCLGNYNPREDYKSDSDTVREDHKLGSRNRFGIKVVQVTIFRWILNAHRTCADQGLDYIAGRDIASVLKLSLSVYMLVPSANFFGHNLTKSD